MGQSNGAPIYLKDVATAKQGVQDERIDMRFWARGYPKPGATVVVAVFRRAGANAVAVSKSVRDVLPNIQSQLPSSVLLVPAYDRSQHHRRQHQGRASHALHRVRAGGAW